MPGSHEQGDAQRLAAMCAPVRARVQAGEPVNRARECVLALIARLGPGPRPPPGPIPGTTPRVLLIRPDHLGDVLCTSPAVQWLQSVCPWATITYMAGPWSAEVAARLPGALRVWSYPFPGFARSGPPGPLARILPYVRLWWLARQVRAARFDLAVNLRPDFWWGAALMYLAHIPRRLGYLTPGTAPFLTDGLPSPESLTAGSAPSDNVDAGAELALHQHVVEHNLDLAELALAELGQGYLDRQSPPVTLEPTEEDRAEAFRLWALHRLDAPRPGVEWTIPPVIAVAPGAGSPAKIWAPERWALVIDHLAGRYGVRCLVTGTPAERPLAERLVAALSTPAAVVVGETSVGVLATLLQQCRLAIGPDNGMLHLAAAMGVPTVRLFGPADPVLFGPYGPTAADRQAHAVVQTPRPCAACGYLDLPPPAQEMYPCMADITAEEVIAAALRVWVATEGDAPRRRGRATAD